MLSSLFGLICTVHVLGLRLFCVCAAPGPPKETRGSNLEPIIDEISMVQTSMRSHKHSSGQEPVVPNDNGRAAQQFSRVPVYGYDRVRHDDHQATWMVMFPETYTTNMLREICSKFTSPGRCNYVGHPDEGGLAYLSITSFEDQMRFSIASSCAAQQTGTSGLLCAARYVELDAPTMLDDPHFPVVHEDTTIVRNRATWGLDRLDKRANRLDGEYKVEFTGKGVHVFLFDTGINCELDEFSHRAIPSLDATVAEPMECQGTDFTCAMDNHGHGTHTAGTVASETYGVAKHATIHSIKILDDSGYGSWTAFTNGIDWVIAQVTKMQLTRAVVSASLGGTGPTAVVSEAVRKATDLGIAVVVAAGNADADACMTLPASVKAAITVGSTEFTQNYDIKSSFSNYGACIDIFAPGTNITSLSDKKNGAPTVLSGTSMACPHVAGVVALLFEQDPSLTGLGAERALKQMSSKGCVKNLFPRGSTPNKLLYFGSDPNVRPCGRPDDY